MKMTLKKSLGIAAFSLLLPWVLLGLQAGCTANRPADTALQPLQGTWEGFGLSREASGGSYVKGDNKVTITITGDSLYFHERSNFWWDTTFTLPVGKDPHQLHATIKRSADGDDSTGKVVIAFYKLENGAFTLGGIRDKDSKAPWPKSFEATEDTMTGRYELRKVQPQKKETQPSKTR